MALENTRKKSIVLKVTEGTSALSDTLHDIFYYRETIIYQKNLVSFLLSATVSKNFGTFLQIAIKNRILSTFPKIFIFSQLSTSRSVIRRSITRLKYTV